MLENLSPITMPFSEPPIEAGAVVGKLNMDERYGLFYRTFAFPHPQPLGLQSGREAQWIGGCSSNPFSLGCQQVYQPQLLVVG